ncbi:glutamate--cysteine ligase, partial [candidate division KSB1 bacterium]|nr:glutamate--cysteine ligase [candidate division KSB1 bacterium]
MWKYSEIITALSETDITALLKNSLHGIERECLRVNEKGDLSQVFHPHSLGSKLSHPFITTDYAEGQLELVTNPFADVKKTLAQLFDIHHFVYENIDDEFLWPMSMPCRLCENNEIPIAQYGSSNIGKYKTLYRQGLGKRYSSKMQAISGVHYNFSFPDEFWDFLFREFENNQTKKDFINRAYFAILRNFIRYQWLLIYLFGASPVIHKSFFKNKPDELINLDGKCFYGEYATSLRMSEIGYSNHERCRYDISRNNLSSFITDLKKATNTAYKDFMNLGIFEEGQRSQINGNILQIENEYYASIRPRQVLQSPDEKLTQALAQRGVGYLEIRSIDVDPLNSIGIDEEQLRFTHLFILYCLCKESPIFDQKNQDEIIKNKNKVALWGRKEGCLLIKNRGKITLNEWGEIILDEMKPLVKALDQGDKDKTYAQILQRQVQKLEEAALTPSSIILEKMEDSGKNY